MPRGPEDKFKYDRVLKSLRALGGWWCATPRTRFGISGIPDVIGVFDGLFVAIETKRPDGRGSYGTTATQSRTLSLISDAGGIGVVVNGQESLNNLINTLAAYRQARNFKDAEGRAAQAEEADVH